CAIDIDNKFERYHLESSHLLTTHHHHANKPTNPTVINDTRIPASNIIGTYCETKSDVFLSTMPFNVPIIIPIVEKFANDTKNVAITARLCGEYESITSLI